MISENKTKRGPQDWEITSENKADENTAWQETSQILLSDGRSSDIYRPKG